MAKRKHNIFKFKLIKFLSFLIDQYPSYIKFEFYKNLISNMTLDKIEEIYDSFSVFILENREHIEQKNEEFFLNMELGDSIIMNELSVIKDFYSDTSKSKKEEIWKYITEMSNLFE